MELYGWKNEAWYLKQRPRWDALELKGWTFSAPPSIPNRVGLTMRKGDDYYTMYVAKDWDPEEINTQLLERCEYHAASNISAPTSS